jgi:hypothetical protein
MAGEPTLTFHGTHQGSWSQYDTTNSPLPTNYIEDIAIDYDGSKWFAVGNDGGVAHFDGTDWTVYRETNSGLHHNHVLAVAIGQDGTKWFGTYGFGAAMFDGMTWISYTVDSGLPGGIVNDIAIDDVGTKWFATNAGVASFDDTTWTVYDTSNSGLPHNDVSAIAIENNGTKWFATNGGGVARLSGTTWTVYNTANSGLPNNTAHAVAIDPDGTKWFGTSSGGGKTGIVQFDGTNWKAYAPSALGVPSNCGAFAIDVDASGAKWFGGEACGVLHYDGKAWTVYNASNSPLPSDSVHAVTVEQDGTAWFGTIYGASVRWDGPDYAITGASQWQSSTQWQATYDVTSLIPRDSYIINVSGAVGTDGLEIAVDERYTFTVDYAGAIADTTPPPVPSLQVDFCLCSTTEAAATWMASDPDSSIDLYQYALGTAPGSTDVINWTSTSATSVTRTGLNLIDGQRYYVSVKARNEGGLWSESASGSFVAGAECSRSYLPLISRNQ